MKSLLRTTLIMVVLAVPALSQEFRFVSFDFPGCTLSSPNGINAHGKVAGHCVDSSGVFHGFLFDLSTGQTQRFDHPGATFTIAADINARGEVVGRWIDSNGLSHGYRRDINGDFHSVDPPASSACVVSGLPNVAHGINDVGDIVGRCHDATGHEHGFVLWRDGTFELIDFPGSLSSDAWVITTTDKVIGGDYSDAEWFVHGFTWSRSGGFRTVDFPGAVHSAIRTVTENGAITGIYSLDPFGQVIHGFLAPDVTVDYPGGVSTNVVQINNSGLMVGNYDDANGGQHGFLAVRSRPSLK